MAVQLIDPNAGLRLEPVVERPPGLVRESLPPSALLEPDLIRLAALRDPATLRALVAAQRPDLAAATADGSDPMPLSGGYALLAGRALLIGPECCGDLGDLASWRQAAAVPTADWQEYWIGHPCMLGRHAAGEVWLSPGHEPDAEPREPAPDAPVYRLPAAALVAAITGAEEALAAVAPRLEAALHGQFAAAAARLGTALLGRRDGQG